MTKARLMGKNNKYPSEIEWWTYGMKVPEWLSDRAKIKGLDGNTGEAILEFRNGTKGGYEIVDSTGMGILVKTNGKQDIICFNSESKELFSLRPIQFDILYSPYK